jgi:hypothetical protein
MNLTWLRRPTGMLHASISGIQIIVPANFFVFENQCTSCFIFSTVLTSHRIFLHIPVGHTRCVSEVWFTLTDKYGINSPLIHEILMSLYSADAPAQMSQHHSYEITGITQKRVLLKGVMTQV